MNHKSLSTIISNTLAQLVAKFFGAGLTLLTTLVIIRLSGLELYGDLTKILILVAVGFTAIDFGLNAEGIRRSSTKDQMFSSLVGIASARLALSVFVALGLNILIFILPGGYSHAVKSVFWVGSLAIIFQGVFTSCNSYFQYTLSYWSSTLATTFGAFTTAALTLFFLKTNPTLLNLTLATTLGYFVTSIIAILKLPSPYIFNPRLNSIKKTLNQSLILGLILVASVISSKLDTIILGIFRSSSEVGQYGFSYRIFDVLLVFPIFLMNTLYPLMVKKTSGLLKNTLITLGISGLLIGIASYIFAPLILYIRPGLELSVLALRILALSLPLFYLTAPLMWQLIVNNQDRTVLRIYIIAAIFNGVANYLLIPVYGALSAALITGITELFIFSFLLYSAITSIHKS